MTPALEREFVFDDINPLEVYGSRNEKLELLKQAYPQVKFVARGNTLKAIGDGALLEAIAAVVEAIAKEIRQYGGIDSVRMRDLLHQQGEQHPEAAPLPSAGGDLILRGNGGKPIVAKTPGQRAIVKSATQCDVVFAVGPAGTGKTYTAVALAVDALNKKLVKKIVLTRPAVEAGESLGFLPGDLKEKIDPYLRPLYDSLEDMIPAERLKQLMEKNIIEIAPLAYMRGRTLNHAFIILDEAQNATRSQLKMFLTRMGMDSKVIATGDSTQIDLPKRHHSGLLQAMRILDGVKGIAFVRLGSRDVVRHPLVVRILEAYEKDETPEHLPTLADSDDPSTV